jgi:Amt family ammonium transporter
MWAKFGKPDPSFMCNGILAGLVAITAPCAFVSASGAIIIGIVSGALVVFAAFFVERTVRIDDPVGAIAVHGFNGAWGVIAVGLFANGSYGAGWGGVHVLIKDGVKQIINNDAAPETLAKYAKMTSEGWADQGVSGIFAPFFGGAYSDWGQLGAQTIGTLTNLVFIGVFAFIWFKLSNLVFPIRVKAEDEVAGLDMPEMGAEAYPDYQLTDRSSPPRN